LCFAVAVAGCGSSGDAGDGGGGPVDLSSNRHDSAIVLGPYFNVTGNLAGLPSECGNMSFLTAHPTDDVLIAGIAQKGLWSSTDGGTTWTALGSGSGSAAITNRTSSIVFDPTTPSTYWESGIYNNNGVYKTTNAGSVFSALGDAHHCDSIAVDFSDASRQTLMAGGHETAQSLFRSTNAGSTWTNVGMNMSAGDKKCNTPLIIDGMTHVVGCWDYDGSGGISRTTNGGTTWSRVYDKGISYGGPLNLGSVLYYPRSNDAGLVRSSDGGKTWIEVGAGGDVSSLNPVALPGGRIGTWGPRGMMVSSDSGDHWTVATPASPWRPNGIAYSMARKTFYLWHFSCGNGNIPVPDDAIIGIAYDPGP